MNCSEGGHGREKPAMVPLCPGECHSRGRPAGGPCVTENAVLNFPVRSSQGTAGSAGHS